LKPIYYGFKVKEYKEHTPQAIDKMEQPFRNIYRDIREWGIGVEKIHKERKKNSTS
jgi:glutamine synthetase